MTKLLKLLWALPMTLVGVLMALVYLPKRVRFGHGGVIVHTRWLIGFEGTAGQTFGHVILVKGDYPSERLLRHEGIHVQQAEKWGPLFPVLYVGHFLYFLLWGSEVPWGEGRTHDAYWRISFEVEARWLSKRR